MNNSITSLQFKMAYLLVLMISLICDSTGQPLYNNLGYEDSVDNKLTCFAEFYSRELQLEKQVQKLTKEIKYLKDWTSFMNSEYWLGRKEATWNDAQASCKAVDSKLVEIESEAEDVFVRALAMKLTGSVWLGGTDFGVEGRWVWESDRSAFTYSAWNTAKEQPKNYFKQNCLRLSNINNLTWFDQNCDITYQYICERNFFPN